MAIAGQLGAQLATPAAGSVSWTHNAAAGAKGIVVWVVSNGGQADEITSVTYGGTAMTQVGASPSTSGATEPSVVHCFFLGSSVPSGSQTIAVTASASTMVNAGYSLSLTAATSTTVLQNSVALVDDATADNVTTTLGLSGVECYVALAGQSGHNAITSVGPRTGWADFFAEQDFGTQVAFYYYYSTIGTSDVTVGISATAEQLNLIAVAVAEPVTTSVKDFIQSSGFIPFAR